MHAAVAGVRPAAIASPHNNTTSLPVESKRQSDRHAEPAGERRPLSALIPVIVLLVAAGALFAGRTGTGTEQPAAMVYLTEDYPLFNYDDNGTARGIAG